MWKGVSDYYAIIAWYSHNAISIYEVYIKYSMQQIMDDAVATHLAHFL
jgi:hypothetical protein